MSECDEILIVDDDPLISQLLLEILSREGFPVRSADSGECALSSVAAKPPKLILMDINMPGMDGFEVCRRLREKESNQTIPILFLSGTEDQNEKIKGFSLGAVDFIPKPFQRDELLARIRNHLELSRLRADLEAQVAQRTNELRQSESYFRELINSAPVPIAVSNEQGNVEYVNARFVAAYGFKAEDIPSLEDWWRHTYQNEPSQGDVPCVRQGEKPAPINGYKDIESRECQIICKDGTIRIAGIYTTRIGDKNIFVFSDVTERKQAEESFSEIEKIFSLFMEHSPIYVFFKDETSRPIRLSRNYEQMLGKPIEELVGKATEEIFPSELARCKVLHDSMVIREGKPVEIQEEFNDRIYSTIKFPIFRKNKPPLLAGFSIDITEHKHYENNIRELSRRNQRLLSSVGEGIYGLDTKGQITFINPAAAKMLQYDDNDLIGQNSHDLFHHTKIDGSANVREDCPIYMSFNGGITHNEGTDFFWRKDGTALPVEFTSTPIKEGDRIIGAVVSFKDITERIQSLEKLRKALGATVQTIAAMVEKRDPYTAGHQRRVADLSRAIAAEMGLPSERIDGLRIAGVIHDIGKISVPAEILSKPKALTNTEFSLIKTHSQSGCDILQNIEFPWPVADMIVQHHERMNGSGYPNGLAGDQLLIESRILAVADVVESMSSHRPYRPSLGIDAALDEIDRNRGSLYDSDVSDACLRLFRDRGYKIADRL